MEKKNIVPSPFIDDENKPISWKLAFLYSIYDTIFFGLKFALLALILQAFWNSLIIEFIKKLPEICPLIK